MSRSKIWGFTALVVVSGWVGLWVFTQRAVPPAIEQATATLRSGTLQFETGTRLLARQVRDVAVVAARDPALASALAAIEAARTPRPPGPGRPGAAAPSTPPDVAEVAESAIHGSSALLDVEMGRAPLVGIAHDRSISLRVGEQVVPPRDPLAQALLGSGAAPRHVRVGDAIYAVAVVPAGKGATLAFGLPIDPRWAERLQAATGADLTFLGSGLVSTLSPADATTVVAAAKKGNGGMVDAGRSGPVSLVGGLPGLPVLFAKAPAWRARALSLPGIDGPVAVISAPTRAALDPIAVLQQVLAIALVALTLIGIALGFSRDPVVPSHVPRELAAVADRIARGDFDVRVPRMSGTFGTLAAALSRAAETARLGRITQVATTPSTPLPLPVSQGPVTPAPTLDVPLHAVPPDEVTASRRLDEPFSVGGLAPPGTPTPTPLQGGREPSLTAAAVVQAAQAARSAYPRTTQPLVQPGAVPAPRPTPAPAAPDGGEAQWNGVFQEFLRTRTSCGESVEGLTWDRFRDKLRKNHDALAQKYACRTVRFQVYVKDGKAALKATPVR
jgi:hypothetical protein